MTKRFGFDQKGRLHCPKCGRIVKEKTVRCRHCGFREE